MADTKISQLSTVTSLADADLFAFVDDPGGTPVSRSTRADSIRQYTNAAAGSDPALYPLKAYTIEAVSITSTSGAITIDYDLGNAYEHTLDENITSITISNAPTSGDYGEIIIKFIQDGTGSRTVAGWPAAVKWPGGTAPTITTTATTGTDIITLKTWDGGTTWYGDFQQDYS